VAILALVVILPEYALDLLFEPPGESRESVEKAGVMSANVSRRDPPELTERVVQMGSSCAGLLIVVLG